ncbi:MAG: hypothetical protein QXO93_03180 [Acidilobaceae archaeon]
MGIQEKTKRAIRIYNKFRGREARAKLVEISNDTIKVSFQGSFCETCGLIDWIEDFVYVARSIGLNVELSEIIEPRSPYGKWRGIFRIIGEYKGE